MAVKRELDDINGRIKYLQKLIFPDLMKVGFKTREHLIKNWLQGRGADGIAMKRLSDNPKGKGYKTRKEKSGRNGIPDLNWTGRMQQSLESKRRGKDVIVTFSQVEMGKARGNFKLRKNMMILNKKFKDQMSNFILKRLSKTKGAK